MERTFRLFGIPFITLKRRQFLRYVCFVTRPISVVFCNAHLTVEAQQDWSLMVEAFKPDFIWVGLGAPKQEKYVVEMARQSQQGVWLAVGAAFDFYAGTKPRAPKFLQYIGMEWAFRLLTEPRRLAPRYFRTNPVFLRMSFRELLGI